MGIVRKLKGWLPWLFVVIWMMLIFNLSSQPADQSSKLSSGITEKVVETIQMLTNTSDADFDHLHHIVRKCAHFSAYLILALFVLNALRNSGQTGIKKVGIALIICVLYASSDEFHQMFVPGRGPQIKDVLIDSAGSITGFGVYFVMKKILGRKSNKIA